MTGFGRGQRSVDNKGVTIELRAVNHRHLDLKLRSQVAPSLEEAIATKIRAAIERGSITVAISIDNGTQRTSRIDRDAALAAHRALSELATALGTAPPELPLVLAQPGVIAPGPVVDDALVLAALDEALADLERMRQHEGAQLAVDIVARFAQLALVAEQIAAHAHTVAALLRTRLVDRLTKLAVDVAAIDPSRITAEAALAADRADITEELVRLRSHLHQANGLALGAVPSGRKLDFLVQEIGRELNTIGSKSALAEITSLVVEGKAQLEKIREQVQNVE